MSQGMVDSMEADDFLVIIPNLIESQTTSILYTSTQSEMIFTVIINKSFTDHDIIYYTRIIGHSFNFIIIKEQKLSI